MPIGLIGRKVGMTRFFTENGTMIPLTVINIEPNRVYQIKSVETDGYSAIQLGFGKVRSNRVSKPMAGHFAKSGVEGAAVLCEFRLEEREISEFSLGAEIKVDRFAVGQSVDVRGVTKGRGFAGVIRRHHFHSQDSTHGNSLSHRAPGSIGQNQSPGRVFKGKRMSGHMGNVNRCQQNLKVERVDAVRNLLLVKGSVPGPVGGILLVSPSVKQKKG